MLFSWFVLFDCTKNNYCVSTDYLVPFLELPPMSRTLRCVLAAWLAVSLPACAQTNGKPSPSGTESSPSQPEDPSPETASSPSEAPETGPSTIEATSPAPPERSPALVDLEKKLRPQGSPAAAQPAEPERTTPPPAQQAVDEETARLEVEAMSQSVLEAISRADTEKAKANLVSDAELARHVNSGFVGILASNIPSNEALLAKLVETLQGKKLSAHWEPKSTALSPENGVFVRPTPITSGTLHIDADGVALEVEMGQVVKIDGAWKILYFNAR